MRYKLKPKVQNYLLNCIEWGDVFFTEGEINFYKNMISLFLKNVEIKRKRSTLIGYTKKVLIIIRKSYYLLLFHLNKSLIKLNQSKIYTSLEMGLIYLMRESLRIMILLKQ